MTETVQQVGYGLSFREPITPNYFGMNGGDDETRTRDLCRDRERFDVIA
jgi:hypothetical protein